MPIPFSSSVKNTPNIREKDDSSFGEKKASRFTFYDGPPFATGLPHYGHLLTSTIKDIIPRYWSMKGYHTGHVRARCGPENGHRKVQCRVPVHRDDVFGRVEAHDRAAGRWVNFDDNGNDYESMDLGFMESCWWVFKQLFDKGHVYRAYQIMPYSTALGTPLSHMESKQNEKMTHDPAVLVSFPVLLMSGGSGGVEGTTNDDEDEDEEKPSLVVCTTTPWTLHSNLLITVHPDLEYLEILDEKTGRRYIMLESGLSMLYKDPKKARYSTLRTIPGKSMVGWKYKPLFNYFSDTFPDFFREDYDAAVAAGFITPSRLPPCPVDEAGRFTSEVPDYAGQHVKAADKTILKDLRSTGRLLVESQVGHVDKFCWRSDTQLIRRAVTSWFIRVTDSIPEMLKNLEEQTNWVPNRYWGTPIPVWVSDDFFDCWFESGSMPYASIHYPFEKNSEQFHNGLFPADFIAEGLDQTRGWFYTLTVLGKKLFGTSPFKNVIVNGLVFAEDGKKMYKSLKNYPDSNMVLDRYGSDALRLYLINSPVVRAEPMWFRGSGSLLYRKTTGQAFVAQTSSLEGGNKAENVMDRWILADCQSLLRFIEEEMRGYRLYTVVPRLLQNIDNLTNWYIRFNRKRLKGVAGPGLDDTTAALNTLLQVLFTLVRALAPFTPFLTEHIYQLLRPQLGSAVITTAGGLSPPDARSVIQLGRAARERRHSSSGGSNLSLKAPLMSLAVIADSQLLADIDSSLTLKAYIGEGLNVRNVILAAADGDDEERFNIVLEARVLDWPSLGRKLKKDVQMVRKALPTLGQAKLRGYQRTKTMVVDGITLGESELTLVRVIGKGKGKEQEAHDAEWEPAFADDMVVLLDFAPHPELVQEGMLRELVSLFQRLRKKAGLAPTDEVRVRQRVVSDPDGIGLGKLVAARQDLFVAALRGNVEEARDEEGGEIVLEEEQLVENAVVMLQLCEALKETHQTSASQL
ncbi:putative Isoleucyl-tRNA synthetase [Podospora didyma]|uniref:isoleucine--tRNA ligase n=1 Tax=Podospora didyma TaxID=330526 RepID=A0AAE0N8Q1_9PEZI|nr:putative Isoleucyl-tRNA synthetase [Podospora didyma]